jgi:PAS domain S-box-containing protein
MVVRPDGSRLPVEVGLSRFMMNGEPAAAAFIFDISERKKTEAALAESEARFRTLVESSRDVAIVCKGETLVYANPALAKLLGFDSVDQLRGKQAAEHIHPDELRDMRERWSALREHPDPAPIERRVRHKDGHYVTVEAHTIPIRFDGEPAVFIFGRDITARRAEQQRLLQQDRMAAVGTLAAGVAHEINNPLAYVMLNLDMVLRELPRAAADAARLREIADKLREARDGAERVALIVRDLLAFARPDDSLGPVDVRRTIDTAIKMVRGDLRERATLTVDCPADMPEVDGNPAKLGQVFLNLLMNAMQAIPIGGKDHEVSIRGRCEQDRCIVIEVSDTGPGIPEEVLPRVFEPFFTTKPLGEGTGLGLSICHGIVSSMGGDIGVKNLPGRGAMFTVRLPVPARYLV